MFKMRLANSRKFFEMQLEQIDSHPRRPPATDETGESNDDTGEYPRFMLGSGRALVSPESGFAIATEGKDGSPLRTWPTTGRLFTLGRPSCPSGRPDVRSQLTLHRVANSKLATNTHDCFMSWPCDSEIYKYLLWNENESHRVDA